MRKYLVCILIGILLFLILNIYNTFSIGALSPGDSCGRTEGVFNQENANAECNNGTGDCGTNLCMCDRSQNSICVFIPEDMPPEHMSPEPESDMPDPYAEDSLAGIACNTPAGEIRLTRYNLLYPIRSIFTAQQIEFLSYEDLIEISNRASGVVYGAPNPELDQLKTYIGNIYLAINNYIPPHNCNINIQELKDRINDEFISNFILNPYYAASNSLDSEEKYNNLLKTLASILFHNRVKIYEEQSQAAAAATDLGPRIEDRSMYTSDYLNTEVKKFINVSNISQADLTLLNDDITKLHDDIEDSTVQYEWELDARILDIQLSQTRNFPIGLPISHASLFTHTVKKGVPIQILNDLLTGKLQSSNIIEPSEGAEMSQCTSLTQNFSSGILRTNFEMSAINGPAIGTTGQAANFLRSNGIMVGPPHSFLWCHNGISRPIPRLLNAREALGMNVDDPIIENPHSNSHIYIRLAEESGRSGPTHKCRYNIEDGSIVNIEELMPDSSYELFIKFSLSTVYKPDPEHGRGGGYGIWYSEKVQFKFKKIEGTADLSGKDNRIHVYKLLDPGYNTYFPGTGLGLDGRAMVQRDHVSFDYFKNFFTPENFFDVKISRCSCINTQIYFNQAISQDTQMAPSRQFNLMACATGGAAGGADGGAAGGGAAQEFNGFEYDTGINAGWGPMRVKKSTYVQCDQVVVNNENKSLDIYYRNKEGITVGDIRDFHGDNDVTRILLYLDKGYYYIKLGCGTGEEIKIRTKNRTIRNKVFGHIYLMLKMETLYRIDNDFDIMALAHTIIRENNLNGARVYDTAVIFKELVNDNLLVENFEVGLDVLGDDF